MQYDLYKWQTVNWQIKGIENGSQDYCSSNTYCQFPYGDDCVEKKRLTKNDVQNGVDPTQTCHDQHYGGVENEWEEFAHKITR